MMKLPEEDIRSWVEEILAPLDAYLVDLKIRPGKVEVYADRDPHITIDDCAAVSRALLKRLDEAFDFSSANSLEVSSPGMDQPLKVLRQYRKNAGRQVEVILQSGEKREGILLHADESGILLEEVTGDSKKNPEKIQHEIPFVRIRLTQIKINF